jgi:hypothetical protein
MLEAFCPLFLAGGLAATAAAAATGGAVVGLLFEAVDVEAGV